jgi:hypothetical protein
VINNNTVEQVTSFNYLDCHLGRNVNYDLQNKSQRFSYLYVTVELNKSQEEAILKLYRVLAVPAVLYGRICWTLTNQQLSNPLK